MQCEPLDMRLPADYRTQLERVKEVVFARAVPKVLGGTQLTGAMMATLLPKLAVALNDIHSVGPALVMHMARMLAEECFKEFSVCICALFWHEFARCLKCTDVKCRNR